MKKTEYKFPLIAKGQYCDLEVKFTSEREGSVIKTHDENSYSIGEHCSSWISCFNTDHWTILSHDLNKPTLEDLRRQEQDIQDKIKELEAEGGDWPKEGDVYHYYDFIILDYQSTFWKNNPKDKCLEHIGNVHPTEQAAQQWGEKWINRMKEEINKK